MMNKVVLMPLIDSLSYDIANIRGFEQDLCYIDIVFTNLEIKMPSDYNGPKALIIIINLND